MKDNLFYWEDENSYSCRAKSNNINLSTALKEGYCTSGADWIAFAFHLTHLTE